MELVLSLPSDVKWHLRSKCLRVTHPESPVDFRPISITPVLSRIMEKLVVRNYIYPALLTPPQTLTFQDQFAFRPTGSTTAALIAFYHHICEMLSANPYVRVIALDISKAFNTVCRGTLFEKLARLDIPDEVYNCIRVVSKHEVCRRRI